MMYIYSLEYIHFISWVCVYLLWRIVGFGESVERVRAQVFEVIKYTFHAIRLDSLSFFYQT